MRDWNIYLDVDNDTMSDYATLAIDGRYATLTPKDDFRRIILAGLPKSASLYLETLIATTFNLHRHQIGYDHRGGTVYYPRVLAMPLIQRDMLAHCHADATRLLPMIRPLGLKVIALTRDLFDVIVSRRDMLLKDKRVEGVTDRALAHFRELEEREQYDFVMDVFLAEYVAFIASWWEEAQAGSEDVLHITFEEMMTDRKALMQRLGRELDLPFDDTVYEIASGTFQRVNFNKGVAGRGAALSAAQRQRIHDAASRYGLPREAYERS